MPLERSFKPHLHPQQTSFQPDQQCFFRWYSVKSGAKSLFTQLLLVCLRNKWPLKIPTGKACILKIILVRSLSEVILEWLCKKPNTFYVADLPTQVGLVKAEGLAHSPSGPKFQWKNSRAPFLPCVSKRASHREEGCPPHQYFWNNHLVLSGRLSPRMFTIKHKLNFYYRCSTYPHRQAYEWVYPQVYIFQRKLLLFATVIARRKAPEIFEITYCFSITASNFYPDA